MSLSLVLSLHMSLSLVPSPGVIVLFQFHVCVLLVFLVLYYVVFILLKHSLPELASRLSAHIVTALCCKLNSVSGEADRLPDTEWIRELCIVCVLLEVIFHTLHTTTTV